MSACRLLSPPCGSLWCIDVIKCAVVTMSGRESVQFLFLFAGQRHFVGSNGGQRTALNPDSGSVRRSGDRASITLGQGVHLLRPRRAAGWIANRKLCFVSSAPRNSIKGGGWYCWTWHSGISRGWPDHSCPPPAAALGPGPTL